MTKGSLRESACWLKPFKRKIAFSSPIFLPLMPFSIRCCLRSPRNYRSCGRAPQLKSPTVLYQQSCSPSPVFIRYQTWHVLSAALLAAVSWFPRSRQALSPPNPSEPGILPQSAARAYSQLRTLKSCAPHANSPLQNTFLPSAFVPPTTILHNSGVSHSELSPRLCRRPS